MTRAHPWRRFDSKKATWTRETEARNVGIQRQELEATRAINRAAPQRYFERFGHGYSIIDHRDYCNPNTYMPPMRTLPPRTLWQSIANPPGGGAPGAPAAAPAVRTGGFQRVAASSGGVAG